MHFQQITPASPEAACWSAPFPSRSKKRRPGQHVVHLSQVIDTHLALRLSPELLSHCQILAEITQQAVAHTPVGDSTQLLFHRLEYIPRVGCLFELQEHGEDSGEPAYRA